MKENRSNSRDSRRAPLYHGRSVGRPINSYDFNNRYNRYERFQNPRRFEDHPMVLTNPLGVAFGYVLLISLRRVD